MSRSKWKNPYTNLIFWKKKNQYKLLPIARNSEITPKFVGLTINIHNGKKNLNLTITKNMIKHKFGEFAFTRTNFKLKKKQTKNK